MIDLTTGTVTFRSDLPTATRRVVVIPLIGDPIESAEKKIGMLLEAGAEGTADALQKKHFNSMVARIRAGERADIVLGLTRDRSERRDPDRVMMIALDYWIRSRRIPKQKKVAANVAADWNEGSVETVKQIYRRMRARAGKLAVLWLQAESSRPDFNQNESMELLAGAVVIARDQILNNKPAPNPKKRRSEVVEETIFLGHWLDFYSHLLIAGEVTWAVGDSNVTKR